MSDFDNILKAARAKREPEKSQFTANALIALDDIKERANKHTRNVKPKHIEGLVDSITLLGLIEPLVLDSQDRLVAGLQRMTAITTLRETNPEAFAKWFESGIPVHRLSFDSEVDRKLALQVEVAENEHRADYTPAEVRAIADRFKEAGFSSQGRPRKGQSPLIPALMAVVGKSRATVKRYLSPDSKKSGSNEPDYEKTLRQAQRILLKLITESGQTPPEQELAIAAGKLIRQIEELLD